MYVHVMQYVHMSIRTSNIVVFSKTVAASASTAADADTDGFPRYIGEPFLCGFETARHDKATSDQQGDAHWLYNVYRHPKHQGLRPQERYTMNYDLYSLGVVLLVLGLSRTLTTTGLERPKDSPYDSIVSGNVRDFIKRLALARLPVVMGTKYCDVVLFCLDMDGDGQISNSTVIEEVLKKTEELVIGMQ